MHVVPAIDLYGGKAVRLHQGRYDAVTVYADDPAALARGLRGKVPWLHVVDLEGARSAKPSQTELVKAVIEAFGEGVQVGGGLRSIEAASAVFALGASRVVLGTAAVRDPGAVAELAHRFPDRVIVAVDAKDGKVAVDGWEALTDRTAVDVARSLAGAPLAALLYTDVARDGTQVGPNLVATAALAASGGFPVLASGGVGKLEDLRALAKIDGVVGAIVGRALYERAFSLEEAIDACRP